MPWDIALVLLAVFVVAWCLQRILRVLTTEEPPKSAPPL